MVSHDMQFLDLLRAWWQEDITFKGILMSVVISVLRMMYSGASWAATIFEGLLCGALSLTAVSAMNYFNIPQDMTVAIGGFIGFIGVKKIAFLINRFLDKKV
ncbi:phage holin, lambda family [Acinetobacter nectaris]|uniref:phage holin, lambda family n=1 Tax=Acinetobacter nectaris TaxID=1219382 RepID=UPI001F003B3F|nr:phage holin, lambda family [Acinetobacter nectaris]MCF9035222.1 phage holin, lambda family [Acinetobacter nectaris]